MEEKKYHHGNLRELLIENGIKLVNESGFEQLTMRKLAAACNVSHMAPYRHFKDKTELLQEMQKYIENQFSEILLESVEKHKDQPNAMTEFGKAYVLFFRDHPDYYSFFVRQDNIIVNLTNTEEIYSNYTPFNIFKEIAENFLNKNHIPSKYHYIALAGMWAAVHGLASMATMTGIQFDGDWGELTEQVLKGVQYHE